jgi:hypothetical protein
MGQRKSLLSGIYADPFLKAWKSNPKSEKLFKNT